MCRSFRSLRPRSATARAGSSHRSWSCSAWWTEPPSRRRRSRPAWQWRGAVWRRSSWPTSVATTAATPRTWWRPSCSARTLPRRRSRERHARPSSGRSGRTTTWSATPTSSSSPPTRSRTCTAASRGPSANGAEATGSSSVSSSTRRWREVLRAVPDSFRAVVLPCALAVCREHPCHIFRNLSCQTMMTTRCAVADAVGASFPGPVCDSGDLVRMVLHEGSTRH
mmetsp:Transcript_14714/g.39185  ORF Transcript_14714/g.39185 Transcript_14714/m.39185 type:complete len:224 (-) Transcript_14714:1-672(-)